MVRGRASGTSTCRIWRSASVLPQRSARLAKWRCESHGALALPERQLSCWGHRAAVKSRYAENQTIVFEECATALEKAGGYLGQHHQHAMEEDEIRDGPASPQPGPSLQATVVFVSEYIPIMVRTTRALLRNLEA